VLPADDLLLRLRRIPRGTALFTDFDGTLSPIVADPAAARPAPGAVEALTALSGHYRRVAVLSGRPLAYLAPLLPDVVDIAALYGLEHRIQGATGRHPEAERWQPVIAALSVEAADALTGLDGVTVEQKGLSLTLHFRNAVQHADAVAAFATAAASRHGLHDRPAKASVELHPPVAVDKGTVLRDWATGARVVAFFGDDVGDLTAFAALRALAAGAAAVEAYCVAVIGEETPPEVRAGADAELDGPPAVADLLQRLVTAAS
jgi:trehalose 6-phosphate phosphatase